MNAEIDDNAPDTNEVDREAAKRALDRNWPELKPTSPKYQAILEALAEFHHLFGAASFELRYGLRPPKNRTEEWNLQFIRGEITGEELRSQLKADAERPIDLQMLTTFCDAYQANLVQYSAVLQIGVVRPSDEGTEVWNIKEREIDDHITALREKLPLWKENLETVFEFLEERRITSGAGLVKVGDIEATSAYWLAELIFTRLSEAWRSCKEVSKRSYQDPRYLYAANPVDLFYKQFLPSFPKPQAIHERLREEFILGRAALKQTAASASVHPGTAPKSVLTASSIEPTSIDNESRELMLLGEMQTLVAKAGHIFRPISNSDWGIDGEIEFKDDVGHPTGRRLYVQLKSGDSHLTLRQRDGKEVFTVKNKRHLDYWAQQAYPVMLVIRQSSGLIRWMDVSAYLKQNQRPSHRIIFRGEPVTTDSIQRHAKTPL